MSSDSPESPDALDAQALARCLAGDQSAFAELVRRHARGVTGLCVRMVGPAVGEELAQEAFARAYQSLEQFRHDAHFRHWLYRIALNLSRDHLKSGKAREAATDFGDPERGLDSGAPSALSRAEARQTLRALEAAIARLPEKYREAFVLRHLENLPYDEICAIAGADVGALKVRVHRAREMLRLALGELLESDGEGEP